MNLYNNRLIRAFSFIIISLISYNLSAQAWVESMQDPNASFFETQRLFNEYYKDREYEKGKGWKQFKRWEDFMRLRVNEQGKFTHGGDTYKEYIKIQQAYSSARIGQGVAGRWTSLGPNGAASGGGGAGRLNCYAFHPTDDNYVLAGAASGGLWVSTNHGSTWKTYTDDLATLGISSISFSQSNPNIVFAATGDQDGTDTYSIGVIKSTDAGKTWNSTGLSYQVASKRLVNKVIVHPTNANIVYAATSSGVYKTTDGGASWAKIKIGFYRDMAMKPNDPNTLYFAQASKIIRTTDGGSTFTTLSLNIAGSGRMVIAVTPADPNYIYALSSKSSDNGFNGIYRSTDGGTTFNLRASSPNLLGWELDGSDAGGQGWYDLSIAVSPIDKDMVFTGGVNIWKSTNGGTSWSINTHWYGAGGKPYVHADIHGLAFSPHSATNLWAAADGGAYQSSNNGTTWKSINTGLQIGQIYRLGTSSTSSTKIMTGWQDNGSNYLNGALWRKVLGGDGMECIIDYNNNNVMYASIYYGEIRRTANGGQSWTIISNTINEQGAWVTPYVMHPTNSNTLYAGYANVYKTVNNGNSWTKISSFIGYNTIKALSVAPSNDQVIYISRSGSVYRTNNGGTTWLNIGSGISGTVTYFAIDPTNAAHVWATVSGYNAGNKVFKSTNSGSSWTNISDTLPNLPVNCIVYEKNSADGIYIGTDVGVYYRDNNLNRWVPFMKGLPNVIVNELEIYYPTNKIRAATFGRSVWESDLYSFATSIGNKSEMQKENLKIFPNPTMSTINIDMSSIDYQNASLRILNSVGKEVMKRSNESGSMIRISVTDLESGIYFIDIQTENGVYYGKFIKQ